MAALPRVQFSIENPELTHNVNVNGTLNLLEHSRKHGVKRFVFSSSSSVYGDQDTSPQIEDLKPNCMSPYALHKLVGEQYCKLYNFLYGIETVALRYFNVYGPGQDPNGSYACLIPKFDLMIKEGKAPIINGDGKQTRDFTFVKDVARANMKAAITTNAKAFGQTFNIGAGNAFSVNEVTNILKNANNSSLKIIHGPSVVEPKHTLADISKAKEMLGWIPIADFDEALKITVQ